MIFTLLVIGCVFAVPLLIFVIGAFRLSAPADAASARELSRLRYDNGKHHLRDEHAEGWAVGGGVHFHAASSADDRERNHG